MTTIHKWFWAWDFDKEEAWLNRMADEGLALVSTGLCTYVFREGEQGEYTIRLELLSHLPEHPKSVEYLALLKETGVECVGSYLCWVYLRKKRSLGSFDLFSDLDSRIRHLGRILGLLCPFGILELLLGINQIHLNLTASTGAEGWFVALAALALGVLIAFGAVRIILKRSALKKERLLRE